MTDPDLAAATRATGDATEASSGGIRPIGGAILCLLGLLWLAATLWSAHASIVANTTDPTVMVSSAAIALPSIVAATLLAGAAAGLAIAARFAAERPPTRRLVVGLTAGAGCGLVPAVIILAGYPTTTAVAILAATTFAAGTLGGAAAALRLTVVGAGISATLAVFATGVLIYLFQSPLKSLFGAGDTVRSQADASRWLALTGAMLGGAVAGVVAYSYLRRRERDTYWPDYLIAGASAGLLLLVTEAITLLGGAGLLDLASGLSEFDRASMGYLDSARLNQALVVGFVGGIAAMITVGWSMSNRDELDAGSGEEDAGQTGLATAERDMTDAVRDGVEPAAANPSEDRGEHPSVVAGGGDVAQRPAGAMPGQETAVSQERRSAKNDG